jgi:hypothetical protein
MRRRLRAGDGDGRDGWETPSSPRQRFQGSAPPGLRAAGRIVGRKRPPLPKHIRATRACLALCNMAVDGWLRRCALLRLKAIGVFDAGHISERMSVLQSTTGKRVPPEITEGTGASRRQPIERLVMIGSASLWPGCVHGRPGGVGACRTNGWPPSGLSHLHMAPVQCAAR